MHVLLKRSVALFLVLAGLGACKKDDDDSPANLTVNTENNLQKGTWRITLFKEDASDETAHFNGYTFTFNDKHGISAVKNGAETLGSWSTGTDDSEPKLFLDFGNAATLAELTDDWHILESTANKVRLEDVSGGNGGTDVLTFEKN